MRIRPLLLAALAGGLLGSLGTNPSLGQETPKDDVPEFLVEQANAFCQKAEGLPPGPATTLLLETAAEICGRAVRLDPDNCDAHTTWARCFALQAQLDEVRAKRLKWLQQTDRKFSEAANCTTPDQAFFQLWGHTIGSVALKSLPAGDDQQRFLLRAVTVFQAGIDRAGYSKDHAQLKRVAARFVMALADRVDDDSKKRRWYRDAVDKFDSTKGFTELNTVQHLNNWGTALLRLGAMDADRLLLRRAIQQLSEILVLDENHQVAHYNLACAYSLLNQYEQSLKHLEFCFQNDPEKQLFQLSLKDPELENVRGTAQFRRLYDQQMIPPSPPRLEISPGLEGQ